MLVEAVVLGGEQRTDDELRHVVERYRLAVALGELAEFDSVGGGHSREPRDIREREIHGCNVTEVALLDILDRPECGVRPEESEKPNPAGSHDGDDREQDERRQPPSLPVVPVGFVNVRFHEVGDVSASPSVPASSIGFSKKHRNGPR